MVHSPEQVLVAENSCEALDVLQAQCGQQPGGPPMLVFLDVSMPMLNGIQFLEAYAQPTPAQQCAVVVLLTTSVHPQDVQRAEQLPVADFLAKPLTQQQVERVMQQHFV